MMDGHGDGNYYGNDDDVVSVDSDFQEARSYENMAFCVADASSPSRTRQLQLVLETSDVDVDIQAMNVEKKLRSERISLVGICEWGDTWTVSAHVFGLSKIVVACLLTDDVDELELEGRIEVLLGDSLISAAQFI